MIRSEVLQSSRLAGGVKRYHTWPTLQQQTVADHIFNVLRIYWHLYGPPPPVVFTYLIWSDAGELKTGDLPFPVKRDNPQLKEICDQLEGQAVKQMGGMLPELTDNQRWQVKAVDLLEMFEFGRVEVCLGNKFAEPIVRDTYASLRKLEASVPGAPEYVTAEYFHSSPYWEFYRPIALYLQQLDKLFGVFNGATEVKKQEASSSWR